jgi:hypothetical protein
MKRNRTADAWKSLVMIGSIGKDEQPISRIIITHRSVQLPGSAFSPRNNTPRPSTPCWVSCVLWTPLRQAKISARHAFTRGSQVVLRPVLDRPRFAHFAPCRYQHPRLEAEDIPCGRASDARFAHCRCCVSRCDGPGPSYEWMPLDAPRRRTSPPPSEGRLA